MSNEIQLIEQSIRSLEPVFNDVLSDKRIVFAKELEFAMQIMANSYVAGCAAANPQALKDAITNVAAIGITLNPARKLAYLVPRKARICLDISYRGLMDLAIQSGSIRWAQAHIVYSQDSFSLNGYDREPTHVFDPFAEAEVRGHMVGAYVVAKTRDGDYLTHTMPIGDIFAIRDRSEAWKAFKKDSAKKGPWNTDATEMIKKTVVKQASKYWPQTERLDQAMHYLNTDGDEGIELADAPPPAGKPEVQMPQARPDVTDVEPRMEKPPAQPPRQDAQTPAALATAGEIAYLTRKLQAKGMTVQQAREEARLDAGDSLVGITKDQFISLKDVLV